MKELSKERLLYWVGAKINIVNIREGLVPSEEETQAYRQICQIINSYFLIVNLKSPDYAAGYEQGIFDEKLNRQKEKKMSESQAKNDGSYLVPTKISVPINKWQSFKQRFFPYWLKRIFPVKMDEVDFPKVFLKHLEEEDMKIMKKEKDKCEHDWLEITVHDEKYGKTYKCSKCPEEKFEPNEKEPARRFGVIKKEG